MQTQLLLGLEEEEVCVQEVYYESREVTEEKRRMWGRNVEEKRGG